MVDRVSALGNPEVVALIRDKFIPLAVDATNDYFWRGEEERKFLVGHLNTFVVRTADGKEIGSLGTTFADDYDKLLLKMLRSSLAKFRPTAAGNPGSYSPGPPEGTVVVNVTAKVLGEHERYTLEKLIKFLPEAKKMSRDRQQFYLHSYDRYSKMFHSAQGRDHLWIFKGEAEALARGELPDSVKVRIARYHLEDFTRGQADYWPGKDHLKRLEITLKDGRLAGTVLVENKEKGRGYEAELLGVVETDGGKLTRFDVVAKGHYWGASGHTHPEFAPRGKFPLAVAFQLASGKSGADAVPPNGFLKIAEQGYLRGR